MFDVFGDLNWLSVVVAGVAYYVLGGLWFSQGLFGKAWDKAIGFARPKGWQVTPLYYVGPLIGCLATALAVAVLARALGVNLFNEAISLGLIVGIGVAGAVTFTNAITPRTPRPLLFAAITGIYHVLGIVLASAILFWWS